MLTRKEAKAIALANSEANSGAAIWNAERVLSKLSDPAYSQLATCKVRIQRARSRLKEGNVTEALVELQGI